MSDVCDRLTPMLRRESGAGSGYVCIWRPGHIGDSARRCSVEEWLTRPENCSGEWLIDGGWGGPPGPIKVVWRDDHWEDLGYPPYR